MPTTKKAAPKPPAPRAKPAPAPSPEDLRAARRDALLARKQALVNGREAAAALLNALQTEDDNAARHALAAAAKAVGTL